MTARRTRTCVLGWSRHDRDPGAFVYVPAGTCERIVVASSTSLERFGRPAADEARHDRLLARAARAIDGESFGLHPGVQRFFMRLESRDPRIHLSLVSLSLDGAVCQLLSAVLSKRLGTAPQTLPHPVLATLVTIRADEGRHVRIARALARDLGQDAVSFRAFDLETRHRFSEVLGHFDGALATLGLDTVALRRRIRHDEQ